MLYPDVIPAGIGIPTALILTAVCLFLKWRDSRTG